MGRRQRGKGGHMKYGYFDKSPGVLRLSTVLRRCREQGMTEAAAEVQRVADEHRHCEHHGRLEDPIVGIAGTQIAIACPWCSAPEVLEAWESEGREKLA